MGAGRRCGGCSCAGLWCRQMLQFSRRAFGWPSAVLQLPNALSSTINIHCHLRSEYVVAISGEVRRRQDPNPKLKTGAIEITPSSIKARTCS